MPSRVIVMLISGIILSIGVSCATVPKEPLTPGEVRLLSMEIVGSGIKGGAAFPVDVFFEGKGEVEITKACVYESKERQNCSAVFYTTLGTKRVFQVVVPGVPAGSYRVECYAEYIRNGETRRTNVIATHVSVGN